MALDDSQIFSRVPFDDHARAVVEFDLEGLKPLQRVTQAVVDEGVARLGQATVEFSLEKRYRAFEDWVGRAAHVRVRSAPGNAGRDFHGVVDQAAYVGGDERYQHYRVVLCSPLRAMARGKNFRIFQSVSITDVIDQLLDEHRIDPQAVDSSRLRAAAVRDYLVQYGESDLDFIWRLATEEGLVWVNQHDAEAARLTFLDASMVALAGEEVLLDYTPDTGLIADEPVINTLALEHSLSHDGANVADYAFERPGLSLTTDNPSEYELYDYPARVNTPERARQRAAQVLASAHTGTQVLRGVSNVRHLQPGGRLKVSGADSSVSGQHWMAVRVSTTLSQPQILAHNHAAGDSGSEVRVEIEAIPAEKGYQTPWIRPPAVEGLHTATVTGPAGEEIYTDDFGRVKVRFHWDRSESANEQASCWIRVAQRWAGDRFGMLALPRVGQEVAVAFINGDAAQPVVVGSLGNALNLPAEELPRHKIKTSFRTQSVGGEGYNEWCFDDSNGEENISIHAQRDYSTVTNNNDELLVANDANDRVERDASRQIANDRVAQIVHDLQLVVENDRELLIAHDQMLLVEADRQIEIDKDLIEHVENQRKQTTVEDYQRTTGGDYEHRVAGEYRLEAVNSIKEKSRQYELNVASEAVIQGPGGVLKIDSSGIEICASKLKLTAASIDFQSVGAGGVIPVPEGERNDGEPFDEMCQMRDDGSCPLEECPCGRNRVEPWTPPAETAEAPPPNGSEDGAQATEQEMLGDKPLIRLEPGSKGSWNDTLNGPLEGEVYYQVNDYRYETDEAGRVRMIGGTLTYKKRDRNTYQQRKAGKVDGIKDGIKGDEGGHMVASIFDGPGEQINYSAMNGNLNKGLWKRMENDWAKALKKDPPQDVYIVVEALYEKDSKRPYAFDVAYTIDGEMTEAYFMNRPGGQ